MASSCRLRPTRVYAGDVSHNTLHDSSTGRLLLQKDAPHLPGRQGGGVCHAVWEFVIARRISDGHQGQMAATSRSHCQPAISATHSRIPTSMGILPTRSATW